MARGFIYLAAVVDWFSRRVLAWRLSITMEASFCIEAMEDALSKNEKPEVFNTDQGSQFTSDDFTGLLKRNGIDISMDGKGRWRDNVFVERVWKSIKYEGVYLHGYETIQPVIPSTPVTKTCRWGPGLGGLLSNIARLRFSDRLQNAIKWFCRSIDKGTMATSPTRSTSTACQKLWQPKPKSRTST